MDANIRELVGCWVPNGNVGAPIANNISACHVTSDMNFNCMMSRLNVNSSKGSQFEAVPLHVPANSQHASQRVRNF